MTVPVRDIRADLKQCQQDLEVATSKGLLSAEDFKLFKDWCTDINDNNPSTCGECRRMRAQIYKVKIRQAAEPAVNKANSKLRKQRITELLLHMVISLTYL